MLTNALPSIAISGKPQDFADALGQSFADYGFAIVSDHGIDPTLIARANDAMQALFALPEAIKRRYHIAGMGGARGYTPFGIETAKGATASDLKEFWHIGRDLPLGHTYAATMPPNIWPDECVDFRETMAALFAAFDRAGQRVLSAIALHLGLTADALDDSIRDGNSVLRLLHYPPVTPSTDTAHVRAAAHEDINAITLLLGAEEAGLELLTREGEWLPVRPDPGAMVVNIGDMLQRLTNHRLPSTTHRVVNPTPARAGHSRYSMPFFLHFRPDYRITTLPGCIDATHPDRYPDPITADAYLHQRLREIGLIGERA